MCTKKEKYGCIISYDIKSNPLNEPDIKVMCTTLRMLGFYSMNSTTVNAEHFDDAMASEEENDARKNSFVLRDPSAKDLIDLMEKSAASSEIQNASCIFNYILVPKYDHVLRTEDGKELPLYSLCKTFRAIRCPYLLIFQVNITKDLRIPTTLMNDDGNGGDKDTLPESANMLLALLPNNSNGGMSVADILNEELCKPLNINTIMTTVIGRLKSMGCRPSPKFSSTLIEQLYLQDGHDNQSSQKLPEYSCSRNRCLAYSFHFREFCKERKLVDLQDSACADIRELDDTFRGMGFDFKMGTKDGNMSVEDFNEKLNEIVQDKKKLASCDCIMIILSSHGGEHDILHSFDGCFSVHVVWRALSKCQELVGKPKILLIDACRGTKDERPVKKCEKTWNDQELSEENHTRTAFLNSDDDMSDILLVLSSTEGMKSYASCGGSLNTKYLCEALKKHGGNDFLTILNLTMCEVANINIQVKDRGGKMKQVKQQITFTSALQKLLYLPKYLSK